LKVDELKETGHTLCDIGLRPQQEGARTCISHIPHWPLSLSPNHYPNSLTMTCDDTVLPYGTDLPVTKGRPVRGNREGGKDDVRESECDTV